MDDGKKSRVGPIGPPGVGNLARPELAEPLLVTTVMLDSWLDCALSIPFHEARKVLLLRLVLSTSGIARC
jgi:hypothetical protein